MSVCFMCVCMYVCQYYMYYTNSLFLEININIYIYIFLHRNCIQSWDFWFLNVWGVFIVTVVVLIVFPHIFYKL